MTGWIIFLAFYVSVGTGLCVVAVERSMKRGDIQTVWTIIGGSLLIIFWPFICVVGIVSGFFQSDIFQDKSQ